MDDVLQAVIAMAQAATNIRIFTGSNPSAESIAMTGSGAPAAIYRDMDAAVTMSIVCIGKSSNKRAQLAGIRNPNNSIPTPYWAGGK